MGSVASNNMSELWKLAKSDYVKGFVVAVLTAVLSVIYQALTDDQVIEVGLVVNTALTAGIAYLLKNLSTDSQGKIGGKF